MLEYFTATVWDTSWLIKEDSIAGRLLHTLVGYSEAPNGAQLIAYAATIVVIVVLMRLVNQQAAGRPRQARLKLRFELRNWDTQLSRPFRFEVRPDESMAWRTTKPRHRKTTIELHLF